MLHQFEDTSVNDALKIPRQFFTRSERLLHAELLLALGKHDGALPNDPNKLAVLVGFPRKTFRKCWKRVSQLFEAHPTEQGMLTSPVVAVLMPLQGIYSKRSRRNGRKEK